MSIHIGGWDLALLVVVSVQATVLAYLHHPKWKAFLLALPFPFTLATLAVGRPVDATNVVAMVVLLVFTHGVRLLHYRARVPIVPATALAALGYCVLGGALAKVLPATDRAFWWACGGTFALAAVCLALQPHQVEPGHRSPLPVWIKLPAIMAVIAFLVFIKSALQGFMTMFPMVGVIAAYEARHSLWTISRQIPILMLAMVPYMAAARLVQARSGLGAGLAVGWVVFLSILVPMTRRMWAAETAAAKGSRDD